MRKLTISTDRPLAISGVASKCGSLINDAYITGPWMSFLPGSLLWRVSKFHGSFNPRAVCYQGPSWSWTSVNGPVAYFDDVLSMSPVIKLHDFEVELVEENAPYGAVKSGSLILKGYLAEAIMRTDLCDGELPCVLTDSAGYKMTVLVTMDFDAVESDVDRGGQITIHLLPIVVLPIDVLEPNSTAWKTAGSDATVSKGPLLRKVYAVGEVKTYRRLGYFSIGDYISSSDDEYGDEDGDEDDNKSKKWEEKGSPRVMRKNDEIQLDCAEGDELVDTEHKGLTDVRQEHWYNMEEDDLISNMGYGEDLDDIVANMPVDDSLRVEAEESGDRQDDDMFYDIELVGNFELQLFYLI